MSVTDNSTIIDKYNRRLELKRLWYAMNKDKVREYNKKYYTKNIHPPNLNTNINIIL